MTYQPFSFEELKDLKKELNRLQDCEVLNKHYTIVIAQTIQVVQQNMTELATQQRGLLSAV
jgi:hypothetical protein